MITITPVYVHSLVHDERSPDSLLILKNFDDADPRAVALSLHPEDADQLSLLLNEDDRNPLDPFDFADQIINTVGMEPESVQVKRAEDGRLLATVKLHGPDRDETVTLETRPADALALSLRSEAPIHVASDLLQETQPVAPTDQPSKHHPNRSRETVLKRALRKAVREEKYERAAWLRDRIRQTATSTGS